MVFSRKFTKYLFIFSVLTFSHTTVLGKDNGFLELAVGNYNREYNPFLDQNKVYFKIQDRIKLSENIKGNIMFSLSIPDKDYNFFKTEIFGTIELRLTLWEINLRLENDFGWALENHSAISTNNSFLSLFFRLYPSVEYKIFGISLGWYGASTAVFEFRREPYLGNPIGYWFVKPYISIENYRISFTYSLIFSELSLYFLF